ncbi:hypothetical protein [Cohnella candidum]|uniref:Uncharacterized protein n=1 Tax=Cohnella candidum TaxID=2674991 RepID=A0A3G3JX89_9BACL|nr:hypothetical protein [Cohnella candidum]AYQ72119.1 hypothetical protein EAV92_05755 [Cohnella candidum]
MIQNSTYPIEKMMQFRQAEMNRKARRGQYMREIVPDPRTSEVSSSNSRSLWQRWFTGRRLTTSLK